MATGIALGAMFISLSALGFLATSTSSVCDPTSGGFGRGANFLSALQVGALSSISSTGKCTSTTGMMSTSVTVSAVAGADNESIIDGIRFYWNGSSAGAVSATVTFSFGISSGSTFFGAAGPYGIVLVNSTTSVTGGNYPLPLTDECVGAAITPPSPSTCGQGGLSRVSLPAPSNLSGASHVPGVSTATGLVNLSSPSTVVCPPSTPGWLTGASNTCSSSGLTVVMTPTTSSLCPASGTCSFMVISLVLADLPPSLSAASFTLTLSASVVWQ